MSGWSLIIAAGLVNWFVTDMLVTGEIFSPLRAFVIRFATEPLKIKLTYPDGRIIEAPLDAIDAEILMNQPTSIEEAEAIKLEHSGGGYYPGWRGKLAYMVGCQMCTGTWVGFAEAIAFGPVLMTTAPGFINWLGIIATGLLFKSVGHLTLELVALGRKLRGE